MRKQCFTATEMASSVSQLPSFLILFSSRDTSFWLIYSVIVHRFYSHVSFSRSCGTMFTLAYLPSTEEVESFHRNCASNDTIMTNSCETYETRVLTRRICSCDYSYCNAALSSFGDGGARLWRNVLGCLMLVVGAKVWMSSTAT